MLRMHAGTDTWTDNVKTVYSPQTKFSGGIIIKALSFTKLLSDSDFLFIDNTNSCFP